MRIVFLVDGFVFNCIGFLEGFLEDILEKIVKDFLVLEFELLVFVKMFLRLVYLDVFRLRIEVF